ncbi:MAG: ATP-binding protein [Anaerovoracaceae bacterium]|nr:ATP-binding protein [Bacillota bacterium]MDY2670785.1 ATP-binding protein [Anaerovoracaceae bacterium]
MRETRTLEYKEKISNSFLKTVSAYANYGTGRIIFGVDDQGSAVGIDDPVKACLDIENKINDSISPKPDFTLQIDEDKQVITLTVSEGIHKPYLYKAKAYKRNDSSTVEADRLDLTSLILEGENLTFDELPSHTQELKFSSLEKKLKENVGIENFSTDILRTLGLFSKDRKFNNAASLLADKNDFPGIDIARTEENISYILDRRTFSGISVLDQYDLTIEMYRQYYQYEVIDGIKRRSIEKIPETAFREACANALIHRNWNIPANIRIIMFPDRIEMISPGGLPNGVTKEDYLQSKVSILRNPILGGVFFRMHYIEHFGTGVLRILESYKNSSRKPVFDINENSIRVVLPDIVNEKLSADQQIVYEMMKDGSEIATKDVIEHTGFSRSKSTAVLKSLVSDGFADIVGRGRGTKYRKK